MNHFYSNLKLMLIALLACVGVSAWAADPDVTLDFTSQDNWDIPTSGTNTTEATFTDGTYSIKLYAATNYKLNSGYLLLGKSGSYLELPAFTFDVEKIEITGTSGASTSVIQNIYVGDVAVSTATTGAKDVTNTYAIAENYQAAGTIYTLKVTSSHNTQISTIKIYKKSAGQEDNRTATTVELTAGHATSGEVGATIDLPTAIVKAGDATVDGASITWSSSKENVATIADGKINLVAAGSTTIKATYAGDDTYKGSSASYTLTVTATSLKALQEAVTSTSTPVTIQFNNVFVTAVKGSNAYLADADGYGALVYTSNHGLEAGQVLNGTINANFMLYKGQTEITNFTTEGLTITTEELVPTVKTIDAITAANQSTLVTLKNVTYADGKLSDGTNEITYYDTFSAGTPEENKTYDITGIVILFNSTIEFSPRSASDIVEAAEITTYNVTIVDGVNAPYDTYGTRNNGVSPMTFTSNNASGVGGVQVKVAKIDRHSSWWNVYSMVIQPSTVQSDEEIIITAPNGYLIEGYSINFVSVSSSCLYDVKLPGQEVSEVSTTGDIYTVSGLADKSSSITFKAKGSLAALHDRSIILPCT